MMLLALALSACSSYSSDPYDGGVSVSGTYTGTVTGTASGAPFFLNVSFTLSQNGSAVTGTFTTDDGTRGTISATLSGSSATITILQTTPCAGTFNGTGTITNLGARITGTYEGVSPCMGPVSASFVVNRTSLDDGPYRGSVSPMGSQTQAVRVAKAT